MIKITHILLYLCIFLTVQERAMAVLPPISTEWRRDATVLSTKPIDAVPPLEIKIASEHCSVPEKRNLIVAAYVFPTSVSVAVYELVNGFAAVLPVQPGVQVHELAALSEISQCEIVCREDGYVDIVTFRGLNTVQIQVTLQEILSGDPFASAEVSVLSKPHDVRNVVFAFSRADQRWLEFYSFEGDILYFDVKGLQTYTTPIPNQDNSASIVIVSGASIVESNVFAILATVYPDAGSGGVVTSWIVNSTHVVWSTTDTKADRAPAVIESDARKSCCSLFNSKVNVLMNACMVGLLPGSSSSKFSLIDYDAILGGLSAAEIGGTRAVALGSPGQHAHVSCSWNANSWIALITSTFPSTASYVLQNHIDDLSLETLAASFVADWPFESPVDVLPPSLALISDSSLRTTTQRETLGAALTINRNSDVQNCPTCWGVHPTWLVLGTDAPPHATTGVVVGTDTVTAVALTDADASSPTSTRMGSSTTVPVRDGDDSSIVLVAIGAGGGALFVLCLCLCGVGALLMTRRSKSSSSHKRRSHARHSAELRTLDGARRRRTTTAARMPRRTTSSPMIRRSDHYASDNHHASEYSNVGLAFGAPQAGYGVAPPYASSGASSSPLTSVAPNDDYIVVPPPQSYETLRE